MSVVMLIRSHRSRQNYGCARTHRHLSRSALLHRGRYLLAALRQAGLETSQRTIPIAHAFRHRRRHTSRAQWV